MSIENEAINVMAKEFKNLIKIMIDRASFDRTKKGRIISKLDDNYYEVQLGGETYKAYSPTSTYNENDIVYVKIAENNYNNILIECAIK